MKSNYIRWSVGRTVVTFLGYSLLALAWFFAHHSGKHRDIQIARHLQEEYRYINDGWFGAELPENTKIKVFHDPTMLGQTLCNQESCYININPDLNPAGQQQSMTLMHEMCHVKTYREDLDHGPKWVGCMRDLAAHGAFDNLW